VEIIEERLAAIAKTQADLTQSRDPLAMNLEYLKQELNEIKSALGRLQEKLAAGTAATGTAPLSSGQADATPTETGANQDPSSIYFAAYSDYIKENWTLAIEGFKQYLKAFPAGDLADNALYWIGECYYAQKKFTEAIATFNELISKYREGDKAPAAILKKGFALIEMGRPEEGKTVLKELISRYPLTEEASLAQQKIKEVSE
jgi:tol-pal system protein YbgF